MQGDGEGSLQSAHHTSLPLLRGFRRWVYGKLQWRWNQLYVDRSYSKGNLFPKKRKSVVQYLLQILRSGPTLITVDEVLKCIISPRLVSVSLHILYSVFPNSLFHFSFWNVTVSVTWIIRTVSVTWIIRNLYFLLNQNNIFFSLLHGWNTLHSPRYAIINQYIWFKA